MDQQQVTKEAILAAMTAAEEATAQDMRGMYPMACRVLAPTVQVLRDSLAWVEAERDSLRAFAQKMLEGWPENFGDMDGLSIQDAAAECGLLLGETRHEPCGEDCNCASYNGDMSDGVTCYRRTALLMGPN